MRHFLTAMKEVIVPVTMVRLGTIVPFAAASLYLTSLFYCEQTSLVNAAMFAILVSPHNFVACQSFDLLPQTDSMSLHLSEYKRHPRYLCHCPNWGILRHFIVLRHHLLFSIFRLPGHEAASCGTHRRFSMPKKCGVPKGSQQERLTGDMALQQVLRAIGPRRAKGAHLCSPRNLAHHSRSFRYGVLRIDAA